ncbi:MAG TPA: polymer-forming cytoskeletal protein [Xanthobacteraceae bacterium]|jgi:cytoskeletal protein CcmA (bactofilin family)
MLNRFQTKTSEPDKSTAADADELMTRTVQPSRTVAEPVASAPVPTAMKSGTDSRIGSGMSIVGKIECNGPAQVFGRIEGELRASDLLVGDGATIDGSVIAQTVTVCGRIKGTIRAVHVKLQNGGAVEGDIFHRSLSIDENSLFEGSSRRVENPTEIPSGIDAKAQQSKEIQGAAAASKIDADLQRVESAHSDWSASTLGPRQ